MAEAKIRSFVQNLTRSHGALDLNKEQLKEFSTYLRSNSTEAFTQLSVEVLDKLTSDSACIRYKAFLLIDFYFRRSHAFRAALINDLQSVLIHAAEIDPLHEPLPPPRNIASQLKTLALKTISFWNEKFGSGYRKLTLAYESLSRHNDTMVVGIERERLEAAQREEDRARRRRDVVQQRVTEALEWRNNRLIPTVREPEVCDIATPLGLEKRNTRHDAKSILTTLSRHSDGPEIERCIQEMNSCFTLLIPGGSDTTPDMYKSDEASVKEVACREHGVDVAPQGVAVTVDINESTVVQATTDNVAILDALSENLKLLQKKFVPSVKLWLNSLIKVGSAEQSAALMKRVISLRDSCLTAVDKCKELQINVEESETAGGTETKDEREDSDVDDDFVDVPEKEEYESTVSSMGNVNQNSTFFANDEMPSTSSCIPAGGDSKERTEDKRDPAMSCNSTEDDIPTMSYGLDLKYWGKKEVTPAGFERNLNDSHRFWRPVENESVVNNDAVEPYTCRIMNFVGKFEPVERPCRAPLKNGKLCSRHDSERCPFHGPIIPRDSVGQPLNPALEKSIRASTSRSTAGQVELWDDPELQRDIELQTGTQLSSDSKKNVGDKKTLTTPRQRLQKKILDRKAVKRVGATLDKVDAVQKHAKFAAQWNYMYKDA